jgi:hypothetical protein
LNDEKASYYEQELKACTQIQLTLSNEPLSGVLDATDAKETWDQLHVHYQGKSKQTIAYIIGELFQTMLADDKPLKPQLNALLQKSHILTSLGVKLDESLVAVALMLSLPPSYKIIWSILMTSTDKPPQALSKTAYSSSSEQSSGHRLPSLSRLEWALGRAKGRAMGQMMAGTAS